MKMCELKNFTGFLLMTLILSISIKVSNCAVDDDGSDSHPKTEDIFEQDLTDTYKIDGTDQGIQKVNLKCGADSMYVKLETEKDFSGVMYTRGSFYKQSEPCFVRPKNDRSRSLEMKFSLDQCQTIQEGDIYTNIVVIQNDPDLVTPGDSAFSLECDFRKPRSIQVEADMQTREKIAYGSRITLTSPDPSALDPFDLEDKSASVHNDSDSVTYTPNKIVVNQKIHGTVEIVEMDDEHRFL